METKGNYKVIRKIGSGGSGNTYLVERDSNQYCLKEFKFGVEKGDNDLFKTQELFEREAKTLQSLNHPLIPKYIDFFRNGENQEKMYLVMEYVPGDNLEEALKGKRFTEEDALKVIKKTTSILDYLHSFSPPIIHRDIKPKNIILTDDSLKLVDFGSVTDSILKEIGYSFTKTGSFGFSAPETLYGKALPSSDIYSLGATAVWMLSGGVDPMTLMNSKHRLDFKGKLNISKRNEELLLGMTETDLEKRINDTEELKSRLYGGNSSAISIPQNDAVTMQYDPILRIYKKFFGRKWDLNEIENKFQELLKNIQDVMEINNRKIEITDLKIAYEFEGKKVGSTSFNKVREHLSTKSIQKKAVKSVSINLSSSDKKVSGSIAYCPDGVIKLMEDYDAEGIVINLNTYNFSEKNMAEYSSYKERIGGKELQKTIYYYGD